MSVKVIITVGVIALAFILWFYFTIKLDPRKRIKETPKFLRILYLILGLTFLAFMWFGALNKSIGVKVLLSLLVIGYVYNSLNGWLFNVKEKKTDHI